MSSYVSNGLIAYFNPNNASSYSGSGATLNSLVGSGITGTLGGTYSYSSGTIRLTNTSGTITSNVSRLQVSSLSNIRTVSMWVYIHSANTIRYLLDARTGVANGFIYASTVSGTAGSDWSGSTYYLNNGDIYDLTDANIFNFLSATGQWVNITVISNSAITDDITLFGRHLNGEALDCSFGPIMIYNRAIARAEQVQNFYASEHNYLRIRSKAINTYSSNGLIAYFNPNNSASYSGSGATLNSLAGSGVTGTLGGTYSYSNGIIRVVNNTGNDTTNNSRLRVSTLTGVRSISMWIYIHNSSDSIYRVLADGAQWGDPLVIMNRENISSYMSDTFFYVNNGNVYAMNDINRYSFFSSTGVWTYVTFTSNTAYTGEMTFFAAGYNFTLGLDCSFGPIMVYNRVLTRAEHIQNFYATEFNYIRSLISYQHPYIALTADSSNGYVASSSGTQDSSAYQAFKAFDLQSLDYTSAAYNFWHSPNSGNNYNSSTGAYSGASKTTVSGIGDIYGEYVQIQLPQSIVLTSFTITPRRDSEYNSRSPNDFVIVGSNDGTTWTQVYSTGGMITWDSELPRNFAVSGTPSSYSYYRLITKVVGNSTGSSNRISVIITEWSLYTSTVSNINTPLYQHPFLAMTTDSSVGYVASSSGSVDNANFPAFQATNLQTTYSDAAGYRFWHSLKTYNSTTGVYTGSQTTTVNGSSVAGEWLQLQLPYRLILRSFTIAPRNDTPSDIGSRGPNDFIVAGSNDGSTWTQVYTTGGMIIWVGTDTRTFTITNPNIGFSYYRLITKVVGNASTVVGGTIVRDSVIIPEWNLFGTETALLSLTTPTSSNIPLIAGGPSSNTTNTLAYGRPGFVSFSRTNSQHLYTASNKSTTFNIATNGGFTAVGLVRFTGTAGSNERIFDFAAGAGNNTMFACRVGTTTSIQFTINNGNVPESEITVSSPVGAIVLNEWTLFAFRYTKATNRMEIYKNGSSLASKNDAPAFADRALSLNYIGKPNWTSDSYTNMDLVGFLVYDRSLSDAEITTCSNILYGSVATTSVPATPVYRLLAHDLMNLNASQPVSNWGPFIQATAANRPTYSDVIQWTGLGKSILPECQAVAFNPKPGQNRWIAGGGVSSVNDINSLVYSNDGVNWTGLGKSLIYNVIGAFTNGSVWIITGDGVNGSTTNSIAVSTDNGLTWSGKGRSVLSVCWEAAWNPKNGTSGRWVAGGNGANSLAYSDDNGTTWVAVPNSTSISNTVFCIQSVVLPDGSTLWVLGCEAGSNSMAWSIDGLTWTGLGTSVFSSWCYDIQYNGTIWVAVGSGTTNVVATSFDGKTWTGRGKIMDRIREVCWTGTYWVASGEPGASQPSLAYSTDGITWTSVSNSTTLLEKGGAIGSRSFNLLKQTLTFNDITKTVGDAAFTPSVSTDAVPNYSSYTFSVPAGNGVATTNGTTITIVGAGQVIVTVSQASDGFYEAATATALLTVSSVIVSSTTDPTIAFPLNVSYTYGTAVGSVYAGSDTVVLNNLVSSNSSGALSFSVSNASPVGCASVVSSNLVFTQAGTVTIGITQAAASGYNAITTPVTFDITLSKATPTISGNSNLSYTYNQSGAGLTSNANNFQVDLSVVATPSLSPSGTYSYSMTSNAFSSLSDPNITFTGVGTTNTITATRVASAFYNQATTTFTVQLSKATPTISNATTKSFTYGTSATGYNGSTDVDLTAIGVSSNSPGTISYTEYADTNNAGTVSSNTLTFSKGDTITIQVNQIASTFYNALSATVTFDVVLAKIAPTISGATNKSFTYGTSATGYNGTTAVDLTALGVSSDSSGTLSYTEHADSTDSGTVSSNTLTFSKAGIVTIKVNQAEGNFHDALSATVTFNVELSKIDPTISGAVTKSFTYGTSGSGYNGTTEVDLTAVGVSSDSSGTLSYTEYADVNNAGTVSSNTLTFSKADTVTIRVNQTEGNFHYALANTITFDVVISKIAPTISGATTKTFTYGTSGSGYNGTTNVDLTALGVSSDSSGTLSYTEYADPNNAGTVSSNTLTFSKGDTVTIQVNQTEGNFHDALASTVTFDVVLSKIAPTISGATTKTFNYGTSGSGYNGTTDVDLTALGVSSNSSGTLSFTEYADSNNAGTVSSNTLTFSKGDTVTIQVNQTADNFYNALTSTITFDIVLNKASQTVSFASNSVTINNAKVNDTVALSGRATSATSAINAIQYNLTNTSSSIAVISGGNIVFNGPGVITLQASQSASDFYAASSTVNQTITVYFAQTVQFGSLLMFASDFPVNRSLGTRSTSTTIPLSELATSSTSSTNPIQYELVHTSSSIASISGSSLVITGSGLITLRAYQDAGGYYNATTTQDLEQWSLIGSNITSIHSNETGDYVLRSYTYSSPTVEYSIDKGDTWSTLNVSYVPGDTFVQDVYSNSLGTVLTVTTNNRIYISRNSGSTWSSYTPAGISDSWQKAITNGNGTKIIAIRNDDYIYYSVDSGNSWNTIASVQPWSDICVNADFTIFAACTANKVFVSLTGGTTWIETTPSTSPSNRWYRKIACSLNGSRVYVTSTIGNTSNGNLYYSANYGQTWRTKGISTSWYGISCDATGRILIAGDNKIDGTIWTSFDGGDNWISRSFQFENVFARRFAITHCTRDGTVLFAAGSSGNQSMYRSYNTSQSIIPDRSEQLLSFSLPPTIPYGTTVNLSAGSSSGLSDFLFNTFNTNIATIVTPRSLSRDIGPTLVPQGTGTVNVVAYQDGNDTYIPASKTVQTTIVPATPTISGASGQTFTYGTVATGYNGTTTVDLTALGITSNSDGAISFTEYEDTENCGTISNNILTFSKAGTVTIRVNQESTSLYTDLSSLSVTFNVTLSKRTPTISGATTKTFTYGTVATGYDGVFTMDLTSLGITSDSPGTLSFTEYTDATNSGSISNNTLVFTKSGTIAVQVNQSSTHFYNDLSVVPITFNVTLLKKNNQILTFGRMGKVVGDAPFTPYVFSNANYSSFTFSVPNNNGVAQVINNGTQLEILGIGRVVVTVTQAENSLYDTVSKQSVLTVRSDPIKSCNLNLTDNTDTNTLIFSQGQNLHQFLLPTQLNFRDYKRQEMVSDVVDYLLRVDQAEIDINLRDIKLVQIDSSISSMSTRLDDHNQSSIQMSERWSEIDDYNTVLDSRADSNLTRLENTDTNIVNINSQISTMDSRFTTNENNVIDLYSRISSIDSNNDILFDRADSNLARLGVDDNDLDIIENRISAVGSNFTSEQLSLIHIDERIDAINSDIVILDNRADSNAQRITDNDNIGLYALDSNISLFDSRISLDEESIIHLQTELSQQESIILTIKDTIYAITDAINNGSLEQNYSSIQEVTMDLVNNHTAEDLQELHERMVIVNSILEELLESQF